MTIMVDTQRAQTGGVDTHADVHVAAVIDPDGATLERIVEASQNCPVDAIIITGSDGEQIYP